MTRLTVGLGLTGLAVLVGLVVALADRPDWWGGPAIFAVVVVLYWSLTSLLFGRPSD